MGMLASLLPGLRDLRTPLTVGYLWLIGLWLILAPLEPIRRATRELVDAVAPLTSAYGSAAFLAVTAVAAYLLGGLFITDPGRSRNIGESIWRWIEKSKMRFARYENMSGRLLLSLTILSFKSQTRHRFEDIDRLLAHLELEEPYEVMFDGMAKEISVPDPRLSRTLRSMDATANSVRLYIANKDLWDQYDRLQAEAELRLSLLMPMLALAIGVGVRSEWWLGLAIAALPIRTMFVGQSRAESANAILIQAIITGVIKDPKLELAAQGLRDDLKKDMERFIAVGGRKSAPDSVT